MKPILTLVSIIIMALSALHVAPMVETTIKNDLTRIESIKKVEAITLTTKSEVPAVKAPEPPKVEVPPPTPPVVGCESYRSLVTQYDWDVEIMMRAMRLESSCNTMAVGDDRVIGGIYAPSCGLLQVRTLPGRPDCTSLKDPSTNIEWAYKIWKGQGYSAWSVLR